MVKLTNVIQFPRPSNQIIELVREIGLDSSRWSLVKHYTPKEQWRKRINIREIQLCLKEPHIRESMVPRDEHGCLVFSIERITAGRPIVIDVALDDFSGDQPRIFVTNVRSE